MAERCEHGLEGCIYCDDRRPCLYPKCIAVAAPGWHYCAVHHPEKILERALNVVFNNFAPAIVANGATTGHLLKRLHDDIVHDLKETV